MKEPKKKLGMKVQKLRSQRRMTQERLAARAGITRGYLSRIEMGLHEPTLTILRRLAKALGEPVTELLG